MMLITLRDGRHHRKRKVVGDFYLFNLAVSNNAKGKKGQNFHCFGLLKRFPLSLISVISGVGLPILRTWYSILLYVVSNYWVPLDTVSIFVQLNGIEFKVDQPNYIV